MIELLEGINEFDSDGILGIAQLGFVGVDFLVRFVVAIFHPRLQIVEPGIPHHFIRCIGKAPFMIGIVDSMY